MFADRVILAGSIYVAFISTAQNCNAQEQSFTVSYELLPGSYLANFSPTKPSVQVDLVGSFDLEFSQKLGRINASLSNIMLSDSSAKSYSVHGSGSYGEVVDVKANPTARPPNTSDFLLELDINEIKGVKIYADLPVNPLVFPAILIGCSSHIPLCHNDLRYRSVRPTTVCHGAQG